MKKKYVMPIVEVEKLLTEGLMEDGHSFNMPTAKDNSWIDEEDEEGQIQNKNLWDD